MPDRADSDNPRGEAADAVKPAFASADRRGTRRDDRRAAPSNERRTQAATAPQLRCIDAAPPQTHTFIPPTELILRTMIETEIRTGRLTPARRRRVVKYAMGMGLSAIEAGRLVAQCRDEALAGDDPVARETALKLVPRPAPDRRPAASVLAVALAATAVFKLAMMLVLGG